MTGVSGLPVLLVHGLASSFDLNWREPGWVDLLGDAGREVIGIDLLGHGTAPKPHDPEAYADLGARVVEALPEEPVDAIGFSLGAMTLLGVARSHPERIRKLVLAGIGRNVLEVDEARTQKLVDALEARGDPGDKQAQIFVDYARSPGNDIEALTAIMKRGPRQPLTAEDLAPVTVPTLVVIGDREFAGPGDGLAAALPNAELKVLRGIDHFATPESFGFIDAALAFIDAVPA